MGNIRVSYFKNTNGSAEVLEENNFYPFGMKHEGYNQTARNPAYSYQYNGKELQKETGWSDYGARMYMSDIARWGVIDPLAEQMRRYSPYTYAYNNPVSNIDPDGRKPKSWDDEQANIMTKVAPEGSLWWVYANGGSVHDGMQGGGDGIGDFFGQMKVRSGGGGGGSTTFGQTQAYRDLIAAWQNGQSFGLSNKFGVLSWWTDADDAQYGQYNMMKFATPSDDKWEGGSYGAITGLSSYLANMIGSTHEEFPIITNPNGIARTDFDASTHDKLRRGDKTFILDWGNFVVPSTFPANGSKGGPTWAGRVYAGTWVLDRIADLKNTLSGGDRKNDSTLSVYNTWTLDKNGSFKTLDTAKYIKNNDSTGFMRFMNSVDEQRRLKIKNLVQ
ncbi:RHS repeat-associated core domain-containing protein [Chryseobacterium indicum]|uniref:RHS repeat-associated core domain-containing protein n=1 Tax=Chryseobacterium indicum TaxID=2766954 RepID=UPI003D663FE5